MVQLWRQRFLACCCAGLKKDAPRAGRITRISEQVVRAVVATLHITPPALTEWRTRSMAEAQGLSKATIHRIWKRHNLKLHLVKVFKISCAQYFVEKLQDVIGPYLTPPATLTRWLQRHSRFHLHFIPTSSSWMNVVEQWFRDLTGTCIRRGRFKNVRDCLQQSETTWIITTRTRAFSSERRLWNAS